MSSTENHPDTVSEAEAAAMLGLTAAGLRSHRLRHEAQRTADALPANVRELLVDWPVRKARALSARHRLALGALVVEHSRPGGLRYTLTRQGAEVARRVRCGLRTSPCAEPPPALRLGQPPRIRYDRTAILAWAAEHPEIRDERRLRGRTISTEEAAELAGIAVSTLKGTRSKAGQARARIDAGQAREGDDEQARCSPPWHWVGSEKRYRAAEVRAWLARRTSADVLEVPRVDGPLLDDDDLAELAGISATVLPGYRGRARRAWRAIARAGSKSEGPAAAHEALAAGELAAPPHVRHEGRVRYQAAAVQPWIDRRNSR